jgi:hypothetical protein
MSNRLYVGNLSFDATAEGCERRGGGERRKAW